MVSVSERARDPARKRHSTYRTYDRRRGFTDDTLSLDEARILMGFPCFWCGVSDAEIGLDRVDNDRPHSSDNVVPSCTFCNLLRSDIDFEIMRVIAKRGVVAAREEGLLDSWVPPAKKWWSAKQ